MNIRTVGATLLVVLLGATALLATVHAYRPASVTANIYPPPVWFEDPGTPGVSVSLYDSKTRAYVAVSVEPSTRLTLVERSGNIVDLRNETALWENFERYFTQGGRITVDSIGTKIEVTGNPSGGIYGGITLAYKQTFTNVSYIAVYATLYTTDSNSPPLYGIRGFTLINDSTRYYYMGGFKNNGSWYYELATYKGSTMKEPGGPALPPLNGSPSPAITGRWQRICLEANYTSSLIKASFNGTAMALSSTDRDFLYPDKMGLTVYQIKNKPSAYFRLYGITTSAYATFRNLPQGSLVEVYDQRDNLVGSAPANSSGIAVVRLSPAIAENASVKVSYNSEVFWFSFDTVMGGDVYEFGQAAESVVVLSIYSSSTRPFTTWLEAASATCSGGGRVEVNLLNRTYTSGQAIVVEGGAIAVRATEKLWVEPGPGWLANVTVKADLPAGSSCTIQVLQNYNISRGVIGTNSATLYVERGG